MPSPFKAKFVINTNRSYLLNMLDISDSLVMANAEYEYVGMNGSEIDPMGLRGRVMRFKTYWFGTNVEDLATDELSPTYDNHYSFLEELTDFDISPILLHPKYGSLRVRMRQATVMHNDTKDYCEIDLELVQDDILFDTRVVSDIDIAALMSKLQAKSVLDAMDKINTDLENSGLGELKSQVIDINSGILGQVRNISNKAREFCKMADSFCDMVETFSMQISQPIDELSGSITFASSIPGKLVNSAYRVADRVASLAQTANDSPTATLRSYSLATRQLVAKIAPSTYSDMLVRTVLTVCTARAARVTATMYKQDDKNRAIVARAMKSRSFDVNGNRKGRPAPVYLMPIVEIERSLYETRSQIQDAINSDRDNDLLKQMAAVLVLHVNNIKLRRQDINNVNIPVMPLHVLTASLGLPYGMAERLLSINPRIKCPTFADQTVDVYMRV